MWDRAHRHGRRTLRSAAHPTRRCVISDLSAAHGSDPRSCRPRSAGLSRDHAGPIRARGVGCRYPLGTLDLEEVWSARHVGTVLADQFPPETRTPMAAEGTSAQKAQTAPDPDDDRKPDSPTDLPKPSWAYLSKKSLQEFTRDHCTDTAAGLTYYSVLALFPALLALISLLGVFGKGEETVDTMLEMVSGIVPADSMDTVRPIIDSMVNTPAAGLALITGLVGALWSASGYVGAFGRAMNRVYEVDEGRPFWKLRPMFLVLTLLILVMVALVLIGLVISGPIARTLGDTIGLGDTTVAIWNWAKWPIMLAMVVLVVALLYYVTPNVQQPKFHWLSIGALTAILTWVIASGLFGLYVSKFGNYNKTYGALAGVIVLLLWLWITNLALLFGAEIDSELERARQLQAGIKAEETLQLPPRDTSASEKKADKREASIEEGRRLRLRAEEAGATPPESSASKDS